VCSSDLGGLAGALLLTVPVPIIGTIAGAAIGCFCGALLAELSLDRTANHAGRVGLATAVGRTLGAVLKLTAAMVMAGLAVAFAIF
jgi:uncharacterized protein YqgC (DUF456 family)